MIRRSIKERLMLTSEPDQREVNWLSPIFHRNFVAGVLQFQLYRALCQVAGQRHPDNARQPLHKCDFYRSPEAGGILG